MMVLVVPCYNEKQRLDLQAFFAFRDRGVCFLFVDDGSNDGTADFIEASLQNHSHCRLLRSPQNQGKAEAVRHGMLHLQGSDWFADCSWVGFWDADLATPLSEITSFLEYRQFYPNCDAIWGSRIYRLGSQIRRSLLRHILGRAFATLIHKMLKVEAYDTQCGAKIFKKEVLAEAFSKPFISRWIFDVEILLRLNRYEIVEYPVKAWADIPGSKIKIFREIFRIFRDILKIREVHLGKPTGGLR